MCSLKLSRNLLLKSLHLGYTKILRFCILFSMNSRLTPPKVVAVHDLSCFGRSSLGVVIPTLSAMGVYVSPLPTALLSTQTDGFSGYYWKNLTPDMEEVIAHWESLGLGMDGIYSGFLGDPKQGELVLRLFKSYPNALKVVDPVMGDNGKLYGPITPEFATTLRTMVTQADIITPNMTEAAMLLDKPYPRRVTDPIQWVRSLQGLGSKHVIITSVPLAGREGECCTLFTTGDGDICVASVPEVPLSLPGTGDTFTSVITGSLLKGDSIEVAVQRASSFVYTLIKETHATGTPRREGPLVESYLSLLFDSSKLELGLIERL